MGLSNTCLGLQKCLEECLSADDITETINAFFKDLIIRSLNLADIKDKIVDLLFSSKVLDLEAWTTLLKEKILNNKAVKTSNKVVQIAIEDAKKLYDDPTLPFISLFLLSTSNLKIFIEAFKYANLLKNSIYTVNGIKETVEAIKDSKSVITGILGGIGIALQTNEVLKQAVDPNQIKREDLVKLTSYYIYFITILPVNIISEFNELEEKYENATKILNTSFDIKFRDKFVENNFFTKFKDDETININDFFNENYEYLKNDKSIRINMVQAYIRTLNPYDVILKPIIKTAMDYANSKSNSK